jgi:hypothetical protein
MFHGLLGMFVPGLVIFFSVVRGGRTVRVRREFVELSGSLVRVVWHNVSHPGGHSILEPFHFPSCSLMNTRAAGAFL